jgi:hypothetical protein
MAVISDLLGIPHFSTSKGSTVRKDFLRAVARKLDVPAYEKLKKDPLLAAIVEHLTREPMDPALHSPGTTITNEALQAIINGIIEQRLAAAAATMTALGGRTTAELLAMDDESLGLELDPDRSHPPAVRVQLAQAFRQEHDEFSQQVFAAYEGRCALTGVDVPQVLKAVRLIPVSEGGPDLVTNGVLLRQDIAGLVENSLLAFDPDQRSVLLHPAALGKYSDLQGRVLPDPVPGRLQPQQSALEWLRERAGL